MLQFVSNQVGDFQDMFEDQISTGVSVVGAPQQPAVQAPPTPQTPSTAAFQTSTMSLVSSQTLSPQTVPLTPPLTPAQTPSPTNTPPVQQQQQQLTRNPPLLQPRPQVVQAIQPQPQQTAQAAIQVFKHPPFIRSPAWKHCLNVTTSCFL